MHTDFVSIKTAIDEYIDLADPKGRVDKNLILKAANDVVTKLSSPFQYVHKIALLEFEDYQIELPSDFTSVIQVAYRYPNTTTYINRSQVVEWTQKALDGSGCELVLSVDCPKCHTRECSCNSPEVVVDVDRAWELAHPQFKYAHMKHMYRYGGIVNDSVVVSPYHPEFVVIKYATHNFFNADKHIRGCLNLNSKLLANCAVEYNLDGKKININVKEGTILLSYFAAKVDEEGYRYIPNIPEVFDTIKWYIESLMSYREFKRTKNKFDFETHNYANAQYMKYYNIAKNKLETPSFQSWWSFIENNWMKVYPYYDQVQSFNRKKRDSYNLPRF